MVRFLFLFMTMVLITSASALIGLYKPKETLTLKENIPVEFKEEEKEEEKLPPRFILDKPLPFDENLPDPSSEAKEGEEEMDKPKVIPTEAEIKEKAEPYVKEILNIRDNAFANIASLEKKIAVEYLSFPEEERESAPSVLMDKYMPKVNLILSTCDEDVERALKKMEAAVASINGDLKIVEDARKSYKKEKEDKIKYYEKLLSSLGQDVSLSSLEEGSVS